MDLKGKVCVVGAAESDLGKVAENTSHLDLIGQAAIRALDDAGLTLQDVDGVFAATSQSRMVGLGTCEYLGIKPNFIDSTQIGGSSFMSHVSHAVAAITTGKCKVALIVYGSTQRSMSRAATSQRELAWYEDPFKPMMPPSAYAMSAARHMHEFGTTREQLAEIAVAARKWAMMNPVAYSRDPLTIDDVLNSPMISYPFTIRDCCLVTDGGGAIVLTSADQAKDLKQPPVFVLGTGEQIGHANISSMDDMTTTAAVDSGKKAFEAAGISKEDIDVLALYDAFTITTLLFLEDLGFCKKGEGGSFVENGRIAPGGELPVNTSGGGLSYCHPGMYGLFCLIEATRQVRGQCGERQVKDVNVALAHGNGGVLSSQCTVVLGNTSTV